ncbi:MAG TPA: hypothetical protein VEU08_17160 [Vicinamibacterales bacterium]|nr:hypothetical protein [Vicinamibacterales bacterium]
MPWILSFPELVDQAHRLVAEQRFRVASVAYEEAARSAPTEAYGTEMLEFAATCARLGMEQELSWS